MERSIWYLINNKHCLNWSEWMFSKSKCNGNKWMRHFNREIQNTDCTTSLFKKCGITGNITLTYLLYWISILTEYLWLHLQLLFELVCLFLTLTWYIQDEYGICTLLLWKEKGSKLNYLQAVNINRWFQLLIVSGMQ